MAVYYRLAYYRLASAPPAPPPASRKRRRVSFGGVSACAAPKPGRPPLDDLFAVALGYATTLPSSHKAKVELYNFLKRSKGALAGARSPTPYKAGDAARWRAVVRFLEQLPAAAGATATAAAAAAELALWTSEASPPALVTPLELANHAAQTAFPPSAGLGAAFSADDLAALRAPPLLLHAWVDGARCRCGDCGEYNRTWCANPDCEACRKCWDAAGGADEWCCEMTAAV